MSGLVAWRTEELPNSEPCFHIHMNAPCANALEPGLLAELHRAFDAFVQPDYGVLGFAPDGGWTALLQNLIGEASARSWIMTNHRHGSEQLSNLGLVQAVDPKPKTRATALLSDVDTGAALATKSLFWEGRRRAVVMARLVAETEAFRGLIRRPEILTKMRDFLQPSG